MKYPPLPNRAYNLANFFDFLGKKLKFWPMLNILILISKSRQSIFLSKRAYNTDHVLDYITLESQFFSQKAPIISTMF